MVHAENGDVIAEVSFHWLNGWFIYTSHTLKTLFNIVEERLKKLLNFDVSAV